MYLTATELLELLHRGLCVRVVGRADGEGDEHLIEVETRVVVAEVRRLQVLDRLDNFRGHEVHGIVDTTENLQCIQKHRTDCAEER